jgi:hypothetical protein
MKTNELKMKWLAPVLAAAVVGAGLLGVRTYSEWEHKAQASEALSATLGQLYQDQRLSTALKSMHEGDMQGAAQSLDVLLCDNILRLDKELASADGQTRIFVEDVFRRIALARGGITSREAAGTRQEGGDDHVAVEKILRRALGSARTAQAK